MKYNIPSARAPTDQPVYYMYKPGHHVGCEIFLLMSQVYQTKIQHALSRLWHGARKFLPILNRSDRLAPGMRGTYLAVRVWQVRLTISQIAEGNRICCL